MAIENTVSIDFSSTFLDSIGVLDCPLLGVDLDLSILVVINAESTHLDKQNCLA